MPGNRVLLRGANSPILAACFLAVFKAGGIAVGTMPLLRAKELATVVDKAEVSHALCDARLADELDAARAQSATLTRVLHSNAPGALEERAATKPATFDNFDSAADDTCLIAFTSGTTGVPKGTMHFHRDLGKWSLSLRGTIIAKTFMLTLPRSILRSLSRRTSRSFQ